MYTLPVPATSNVHKQTHHQIWQDGGRNRKYLESHHHERECRQATCVAIEPVSKNISENEATTSDRVMNTHSGYRDIYHGDVYLPRLHADRLLEDAAWYKSEPGYGNLHHNCPLRNMECAREAVKVIRIQLQEDKMADLPSQLRPHAKWQEGMTNEEYFERLLKLRASPRNTQQSFTHPIRNKSRWQWISTASQ